MGINNSVYEFLAKLAKFVVFRPQLDFNCGDCELSDRCGLPPSDSCIARAEQIARGDWKMKRSRAKHVIAA